MKKPRHPPTLGYTFSHTALLDKALSHRSHSATCHNERLEFLGDAVVNVIITEALYQKFPVVREGELSRLRATLVCKESLARVGNLLRVGEYLNIGRGEWRSGCHLRGSVISDALEAIIAAIYLDGGFEVCKKVVLGWFHEKLANLSFDTMPKDFKTLLQEALQSKGFPLPMYSIVRTEGRDHARQFFVTCTVATLPYISEGTGHSRKQAEQYAAEAFLSLWQST